MASKRVIAARAAGIKLKAIFTVVASMLVVLIIAFSVLEEVWETSGDPTKSHSCTKDVIQASVAKDGSLHVVDSRTYEFKGSYTLTAAVLDPPVHGQVIVHGVRVTDADGVTTKLTEVPFQNQWRRAGGPPSGYYSIDETYDTVYAFSSTTDSSKTFTFDYTYTNAITRYEDVGVLYWQFVGPKWDVSTNDVCAYLHLPVPEGQSVEGGQNVYAFGHGSLSGEVSFEPDGVIDFTIPKVKSGTFAEMRVAFPSSWVPSVDYACVEPGDGLPDVLEEEREWQREAQVQRLVDLLTVALPFLISIICIVVALVLFFRYGREYKPEFDGTYWRDVPEKGTNPAVIGRLMRWNRAEANDLVAVLMQLSKRGIIAISRESSMEDRLILPDKEVVTYCLTLDPAKREALDGQLDDIEKEALRIVFDDIAEGKGSLTLDMLESYADAHPQGYIDKINAWQGKVAAEVERRDFFEGRGDGLKIAFSIAAFLILVGGFVATVTMENFIPLIGVAPGAIVLLVVGMFMPRRSKEAVEIQARAEGLKRWFKDFTNLQEAVPTDAKVWGELLVYAYLFGVMDQVVEGLDRANVDIWGDPTLMGSMWWYHSPHGMAGSAAASGDFFGKAFGNTLTSAHGAIQAAKGGSGGGFGGGGGFSGGGGGGFGGGGGGFSR